MKYIHYYDSSADYNENVQGDYIEPFVALVNGTGKGTKYYNNHRNNWFNYIEYVDMGLTSGTLWGTMNIGASAPEELGNLFAWGEIVPKTEGNWNNYKYGTSTSNITKYNTTDGKNKLENEDDIAHLLFGEGWAIPTPEQWNELGRGSKYDIINDSMVQFISNNNGNKVIIPFSIPGTVLSKLWSSVCDLGNTCYRASVLQFSTFSSNYQYTVVADNRCELHPIRPIKMPTII